MLNGFPSSALSLGADIVVHSAHKTLPAMTMGSFLHINSQLIKHEEVESYLQILQSSSPSYPIMASLDLARHYLAMVKEKGTDEIIKKIAA
ncbi:arginine decarboxylase, partial [Paenibacillus phytohabitans]